MSALPSPYSEGKSYPAPRSAREPTNSPRSFPPFAAVLISLHAASGGSWAEEARRLEKYKRGAHDQFGIDRSAHGIATGARQSTRGHDVSHTDSMRVDPRGDEDVDATAKLVEQGTHDELMKIGGRYTALRAAYDDSDK